MSKFCLTLCRFCLCAWIGAAALFVAAGVAEVRSPEFDSATKNALIGIRFPHYYRFGFTLVSTGLVTSVLARKNSGWSTRRAGIVTGLCLTAIGVMLVDYFTIYLPLEEMIQQDTLSGEFDRYHEASKKHQSAQYHAGLSGCLALLLAPAEDEIRRKSFLVKSACISGIDAAICDQCAVSCHL